MVGIEAGSLERDDVVGGLVCSLGPFCLAETRTQRPEHGANREREPGQASVGESGEIGLTNCAGQRPRAPSQRRQNNATDGRRAMLGMAKGGAVSASSKEESTRLFGRATNGMIGEDGASMDVVVSRFGGLGKKRIKTEIRQSTACSRLSFRRFGRDKQHPGVRCRGGGHAGVSEWEREVTREGGGG